MNKADLKKLIADNKNSNNVLSLSDLEELKKLGKVNLEINRDTNEYFYKIAIDDLINKEFDNKILTDNAWKLSIDEENIILLI